MKLSVILPAYNEAQSLKALLPQIKKELSVACDGFEIIVVDAMENIDETDLVCEENGVTHINRVGGNLYGDAVRTGIAQCRFERIAIMDADGSHNPADLVKLYNMSDRFDIVIGSRYVDGGYTDNGAVLKAMSFLLNSIFRVLFRLHVKDTSNSFRVYNADKLKSIKTECDNFDIVEEILIRLNRQYADLSVTEVPIHFNKRASGESKRDMSSFVKSYIKTIIKLKKISRNN